MTVVGGNSDGSDDVITNDTAKILASAIGQQLLTTLAGFVRHVVQLKDAQASYKSESEKKSHSPQDIDRIRNASDSPQDPELLGALRTFIETITLDSSKIGDGDVSSATEEHDREFDTSVNALELDKTVVIKPKPQLSVAFQDAINQTRRGLHSYVFNKMPIRLLAFDSNGTGIHLIDRTEAIRHITDFPDNEMETFTANFNKGIRTKSTLLKHLEEYFLNRSRYSILSHTWIRDSPGDVVYSEWTNGKQLNPRGLAKITKFCEVTAKNHGLSLGWMDTLCINKDSSTELDESIRSMYKWYRNADICVAYMSEIQDLDQMHHDPWFTRGWTLQELLAPRRIEFYNQNWDQLLPDPVKGEIQTTKMEDKFLSAIQSATSITAKEIDVCRQGLTGRISISRKFELAARRVVTRSEDAVYSLMGLMDVEIPIAYGEGLERAFQRFVRELLNTQKYVMDLFNFKNVYLSTLVPTHLLEYKGRTSSFDNIDSDNPSSLDQWPPLDPIMVTHLGVRITLLLVPGLQRRGLGQETSPRGDFWATVELFYRPNRDRSKIHTTTFDLLCSCIYTDNNVTNRSHNILGRSESPFILIFGIMNVGADDEDILLPDNCISVPLDCGLKPVEAVRPSSSIRIFLESIGPHIFQLKSVSNKNRIARGDLARQGMKLVTIHL